MIVADDDSYTTARDSTGRNTIDSSAYLPSDGDHIRLRAELRYAEKVRARRDFSVRVIEALLVAIGVPTQPAVVQLEGAALRVHLRRVADLDELGELCLSVEVDWRAGAEDVVAQVLDAVPGIAEREWKPVPSVDGTKSPLWIALVDQEWVERLQAAAEQHGVAALADDPTLAADDAAGVAHVVYRSEVTAATVERRMILTACGKRIVPRNDWRGLAECEQCVRTRDAIQRGMAVVWALGEDPD